MILKIKIKTNLFSNQINSTSLSERTGRTCDKLVPALNKRYRKFKGQSGIDNPETLTTLGTQDTGLRHMLTNSRYITSSCINHYVHEVLIRHILEQ